MAKKANAKQGHIWYNKMIPLLRANIFRKEFDIMSTITEKILFEGAESKNPYSFRYYDKNRVIGGDVCSADAAGFIHGLDRNIAY